VADGDPGPLLAMLRPHRIGFTTEATDQPGMRSASGLVRRATFVGDVRSYEVELDGATVLVERHTLNSQAAVSVGDRIRVAWSEEDVLLFPSAEAL
jgi:ABC-type Fe3+/spermidine/putrescine transport system ATPase subunit